MTAELQALTALTRNLNQRQTLEQMLQEIADTAARLLGTTRASVRLLDATGTRLMAMVRAGTPLHADALREFELGEGLLGWVARNAQPIRVPEAEKDPRFVKRKDQKEPLRAFLGIPLVSGKHCVGVLSSSNGTVGYFTQEHEDLLTLLAGICAPQVEIARLSRLSQVDPLTGALNRRGMDEAFPEVRAPSEDSEPLAVIMADLDDFKMLNDRYGHALGDEALRRVAALLSSVLRRGDAVVRFGGEEFLMVLPGLEMARAIRVAERARHSVELGVIQFGQESIKLSISLGVAERRPGETRSGVIERADAAMYAAKKTGKNRVEAAR